MLVVVASEGWGVLVDGLGGDLDGRAVKGTACVRQQQQRQREE